MTSACTKECTEVYRTQCSHQTKPTFEKRHLNITKNYEIKRFKSDTTVDIEVIESMLEDKLKFLEGLKGKNHDTSFNKTSRANRYLASINEKRKLIQDCLSRQATLNLKEVCRFTGCCYSTVKKVYEDMKWKGQAELHCFPHQKCSSQVEELETTIDSMEGTYDTVSNLKRKHPEFSKKWILNRLHEKGFKWKPLVKSRKKPQFDKPPPNKVLEVVSHLAQCLSTEDAEILYVDEMHFPLNQTAERHWTSKGDKDDLMYNRREVEETKLTAIALCSSRGFEFVQIFKKDITAQDFLYFLDYCTTLLPKGKRYSILADNASWHKADSINKLKVSKFMVFNVPHLFQLNLIENAFSFIRAEFRKRILVDTIEDEALLILNIFFDPLNEKRFQGVFRNHIRMLLKYLKLNQ